MANAGVVDLRSDTVTQPTPEMRQAMADAIVSDYAREGCPTTERLERLAAELTGHDAAIFCTSGTMGNLVALLTHLRPGDEFIAERDSHVLRFESGGCAALVGAIPRTLVGRAGRMDLDQVEAEIQPGSAHRPRTSLIAAENTHNLAGGTCLDVSYMERMWDIAGRHDMRVHLDGARLFNAAIALGVPARALAEGCDSVMIDLSKGLSAPYGSLLCGSSEFVGRARNVRQRVGGGVRQIGHMAAAGLVALETMIDRLSEDHGNARRLAEGIERIRPGLVDLEVVQTNIVSLDVRPLGLPASEVASKLGAEGVRCLPMEADRVRLVTHRNVSAEQIDRALEVMARVMGGA